MVALPLRRTSGHPRNPAHYDSSDSGTWDGQLSHPGITDQLSPAGILEKRPEDWPTIIERDGFADLVTVELELTGPESAVLRRILFRAGSASQGCWESLANIGRYLGLNEKTVRRALGRLMELGVVHKVKAYHGAGRSNCYVPVMRIGHFGLSAQNGENDVSILDSESHHFGLSAQLTERTEYVTDSESLDSALQESQESDDSEIASTSVHFGQKVQNGAGSASILDFLPKMDGPPSGDISECGSCGLPWTSDADRHRLALQRGMRAFICDSCREAEIAAKGAIGDLGDPADRLSGLLRWPLGRSCQEIKA